MIGDPESSGAAFIVDLHHSSKQAAFPLRWLVR
jgi:hypothetical protein